MASSSATGVGAGSAANNLTNRQKLSANPKILKCGSVILNGSGLANYTFNPPIPGDVNNLGVFAQPVVGTTDSIGRYYDQNGLTQIVITGTSPNIMAFFMVVSTG